MTRYAVPLNDPNCVAPPPEDKMTREELRGMFGENLPMEAVRIIQDATGPDDARAKLKALMEGQKTPPAPPSSIERHIKGAMNDGFRLGLEYAERTLPVSRGILLAAADEMAEARGKPLLELPPE